MVTSDEVMKSSTDVHEVNSSFASIVNRLRDDLFCCRDPVVRLRNPRLEVSYTLKPEEGDAGLPSVVRVSEGMTLGNWDRLRAEAERAVGSHASKYGPPLFTVKADHVLTGQQVSFLSSVANRREGYHRISYNTAGRVVDSTPKYNTAGRVW